MEWDSNLNLIVYAIGDGLFMERVLNGIAAMYNKGMFQSIGALGLLFGLLMTVVKGVGSGGQKVELGQWFLGLLLYLIMFAGHATVTVRDVGMAFGENGEQTYTVDNVPFGVAVMGFVISTLGYEVTEELEQAFGRPEEVASIRYVGPGRSLDWLAAVRFASNPGTNNTAQGGSFARMRSNISRYISYCSTTALRAEPNRIETMMNAANPLDPNIGLGWDNDWRLTSWVEDNGAESQISCRAALERLQPYAADIMEPAAQAFAAQMGHSGSDTPGDAVLQSFAVYNQGMDEAQRYMLCSVMSAVMEDSIAGSPLLTNDQVNARMMMRQSMEQTATEFAGQESSFRRLMRPLMAFFESLVYAVAPFMALAVGLGAAGLKMVGKYVITTLWVSMWLPTLAIINLFQITMAERALTQITDSYDIGSLAGCGMVYGSAIDWIGTGAMLAAATPAITLMLIFGSSMSAAGIAGAIKGSDTVKEQIGSPDAVSTAAAASRSQLQDYTATGGAVAHGAAIPTLSYSTGGAIERSSGYEAANQTTLGFASTSAKDYGQAVMLDNASGVRGTETGRSGSTREHLRATTAARESGADLSGFSASEVSTIMAAATTLHGGGSVDMMQMIPAMRAAGGANAVQRAGGRLGEGAEGGAPGGAPGAGPRGNGSPSGGGGGGPVSVEGGVRMESRDTDESRAARGLRAAQMIAAKMREEEGLRAAVQSATVAEAVQYGEQRGSASSRVGTAETRQQTASDLNTASNTFRSAEAFRAQAGAEMRMPINEAARLVNEKGNGERAVQEAIALGGAEAMQDMQDRLAHSIQSPAELRTAAALGVLANMSPSATSGNESDRRQALEGIMGDSAGVTLNTGAAATTTGNANVDVGAAAEGGRGSAMSAVNSANVGVADPAALEAATRGGVASLRTADGRYDALGQIDGQGLPVVDALEGQVRAAEMQGGGGDVSAVAFASDGTVQGVEQRSMDEQSRIEERADRMIGGTNREISNRSWNNTNGDVGGTPGWIADRAEGGERMGGLMFNGLIDPAASGYMPLDGQSQGYFENAAAGGEIPGLGPMGTLSEDQATVVGARAAIAAGFGLDGEQASRVQAAYNRLPQNEREQVNAAMNAWGGTDGVPDEAIPAGAGGATPSVRDRAMRVEIDEGQRESDGPADGGEAN